MGTATLEPHTVVERGMSPTVTIIRRPSRMVAEWEDWALFISDLHWDHPDCDRKLLKRHLDQALERNAAVCIYGDLWCAMQGKFDKRSDKSSVRPEHQTDRYLDAIVETAVEWFLPYRDVLTFISPGNHETAVRRNHEISLPDRFAALYNSAGGNVTVGTYAGWLLMRHEAKYGGSNNQTFTTRVSYHHGYGGGGPVTKGVIQSNRKAVYLPDADIVVSGHIHERWQLEVTRERISNQGRTYHDTQTHVQLATYKQEALAGEGWHTERGGPPKPLGGQWVRWYYAGERRGKSWNHRLLHEVSATSR